MIKCNFIDDFEINEGEPALAIGLFLEISSSTTVWKPVTIMKLVRRK